MLARAAACKLGASAATAVALTAGHFPVRVGDLGGRGITAKSTAVDARMLAATLAMMAAATTARPARSA
eukprot:8409164-Pyramimonas_sp.AAC.1